MRNFLSIKNLTKEDLLHLIDLSAKFKNGDIGLYSKKSKHVLKLFLEPSTRTALSFEIACKNLGVNFSILDLEDSSLTKGESILETLKNVHALGFEAAIIRIKEEGILADIADTLDISLINAGEGKIEHPSQALLDAITIHNEFKSLDGLKIGIIGDINHSRVASSNVDLLSKFDSEVSVFQPSEFGPLNDSKFTSEDVDLIYKNSDVIMVLRNQFERHQNIDVSKDQYLEKYGLNIKRLENLKKDAIVMHPGPFNRGIEICDEVLTHEKCRFYKQVENGVYARMAILKEVLNG